MAIDFNKILLANKANCLLSQKNYRHVKTESVYKILCVSLHESEGILLVSYQANDENLQGELKNTVWSRSFKEFFDGRFFPQFEISPELDRVFQEAKILGEL